MKTFLLGSILLSILLLIAGEDDPCPDCAKSDFHATGTCNAETKKCECMYGWTGPNAYFIAGSANKVEADHCNTACHYTHDSRGTNCALPATPAPAASVQDIPCDDACNIDDNVGARECLSDGYCLCHYGWTAADISDAVVITGGDNDGKIKSKYGCPVECHWTADINDGTCYSSS